MVVVLESDLEVEVLVLAGIVVDEVVGTAVVADKVDVVVGVVVQDLGFATLRCSWGGLTSEGTSFVLFTTLGEGWLAVGSWWTATGVPSA